MAFSVRAWGLWAMKLAQGRHPANYLGSCRGITPIMENQMEHKLENYMGTVIM